MIHISNFNEYQQHALRTLSPGYTPEEDIMHAVMGMCGEIGELLEHSIAMWEAKGDPRVGEIGDCLWYCAVLADKLGYSFQTVVNRAVHHMSLSTEFPSQTADVRAAIHAARLMEMVKKAYFYKKVPDPIALANHLNNYVMELHNICAFIGIKILTAAEINVNKLATRYPEKFDTDKAINRDYDAESKAAGVKIS